jgi:peptidoglycan LD-endopeptidase LytH
MIGAKRWLRASTVLVLAGVLAGCGGEQQGAGPAAAKSVGAQGPAEAGGGAPSVKAPRRVTLVWPTPNDAYLRSAGLERFVQPTVSGEINSGLFGSVRSGGRQFHEGLDLFPLERDKKGEALDPVFAALAGVVRHVSTKAGASSYGRYVVLEHPEESPPVYTLYAHLAKIAPGLAVGQELAAGDTLGTMGRSAGGYTIPKDRAHLHFEIGVRMTDRFQEWYKRRGFGSPNEHGLWNGMNLMGLDPLEFFARHRAGGLRSLDEVIAAQAVAVRLRIAHAGEPDFARRYPSLVEGAPGVAVGGAAGWEVDLGVTGAPLRLRRLGAAELAGWKSGEVRIVKADTALLRANRGRELVRTVKGAPAPDDDLVTVLEQVFGWRR